MLKIVASAVLILCLLEIPASSSPIPPTQSKVSQSAGKDTKQGTSNNFSDWDSAAFWEAFATWAIAAFALWQLWDNRRSNERRTRAYLGVTATQIGLEGIPSVTGMPIYEKIELRGTLTVENRGQTPAKNVRGCGKIHWGAQFDEKWLEGLQNFEQSGYVLPGGEFYFRIRIAIEELNAQRADDEIEPWIFFWFGRIDYDDAFGKPRWVNYRFQLAGDVLGAYGGKPTVHPCGEGNNAN